MSTVNSDFSEKIEEDYLLFSIRQPFKLVDKKHLNDAIYINAQAPMPISYAHTHTHTDMYM